MDGRCLACAGADLESIFETQINLEESKQSGAQLTKPVIADWEVLRLLGVGGMGQLWLAKNADKEKAAIKIPTRGGPQAEQIERRFEAEAEILAGLDHPNILQVLDAGTAEDGRLFIATDYVDGSDLRRLLRAERLPPERALEIFDKVCDAIEHAHEQEVVHRDLKPANILVAADGTVKVADFGLAKDLTGVASDGRTSVGDGLGTPYYLAPESMRDAAKVDARADVYSLGVLLYEMLTGSVPQGAYTPISERCELARGWDGLIKSALQDDRDARTGSVTELRNRAAELWQREGQREAKKKHLKLLALFGVPLLAAIGGALFAWQQQPADPDKHTPPTGASIEDPWTNGMGMNFVPIPEHEILICTTETTIGQFTQFHSFEENPVPEWRMDSPAGAGKPGAGVLFEGEWILDPEWTPSSPGFPVTDDHPVSGISSVDAWAFCTWLTMRERAEGRIGPEQRYRLPTTFEWALAGVGTVRADGNFARAEARDEHWPPSKAISEGDDGFPRTAPVASFGANRNGIYDMSGNVAEWVLPPRQLLRTDTDLTTARFLGFSWFHIVPDPEEGPTPRLSNRPGFRRTDIGFRVVLEL